MGKIAKPSGSSARAKSSRAAAQSAAEESAHALAQHGDSVWIEGLTAADWWLAVMLSKLGLKVSITADREFESHWVGGFAYESGYRFDGSGHSMLSALVRMAIGDFSLDPVSLTATATHTRVVIGSSGELKGVLGLEYSDVQAKIDQWFEFDRSYSQFVAQPFLEIKDKKTKASPSTPSEPKAFKTPHAIQKKFSFGPAEDLPAKWARAYSSVLRKEFDIHPFEVIRRMAVASIGGQKARDAMGKSQSSQKPRFSGHELAWLCESGPRQGLKDQLQVVAMERGVKLGESKTSGWIIGKPHGGNLHGGKPLQKKVARVFVTFALKRDHQVSEIGDRCWIQESSRVPGVWVERLTSIKGIPPQGDPVYLAWCEVSINGEDGGTEPSDPNALASNVLRRMLAWLQSRFPSAVVQSNSLEQSAMRALSDDEWSSVQYFAQRESLWPTLEKQVDGWHWHTEHKFFGGWCVQSVGSTLGVKTASPRVFRNGRFAYPELGMFGGWFANVEILLTIAQTLGIGDPFGVVKEKK